MLGLTKSRSTSNPKQKKERLKRKDKKINSRQDSDTIRASTRGKKGNNKTSTTNKSLKEDETKKVVSTKVNRLADEEREDGAIASRKNDKLEVRSCVNSPRISWGANSSWNVNDGPINRTSKVIVPAVKILRKPEDTPKPVEKKKYDCFGFVPKSEGLSRVLGSRDEGMPSPGTKSPDMAVQEKGLCDNVQQYHVGHVEGPANLTAEPILIDLNRLERSHSKVNLASAEKIRRNHLSNREEMEDKLRKNWGSDLTEAAGRPVHAEYLNDCGPIVENEGIELVALKTKDGRNAAGVVKQDDGNAAGFFKHDAGNSKKFAEKSDKVVIERKEPPKLRPPPCDDSSDGTWESCSVSRSSSSCSSSSSTSEVDPSGGVLLPPCRFGRSNSCTELDPENEILLPPSCPTSRNDDAISRNDDDDSSDEDDTLELRWQMQQHMEAEKRYARYINIMRRGSC